MEELIDVLDEFGNKTGIIKTKGEIKHDGDYHRAISILIINNDKILIQKRSESKKVYPNLWSLFVKGHVQSKETSIAACIRELKEELGIKIEKSELKYLYTIKEEKNTNNYIEKIFFDTYILKKDINLNDITIQKEELSEVKYLLIKDAYNLLNKENKLFVPNKEDYERIFKYLKTIS